MVEGPQNRATQISEGEGIACLVLVPRSGEQPRPMSKDHTARNLHEKVVLLEFIGSPLISQR